MLIILHYYCQQCLMKLVLPCQRYANESIVKFNITILTISFIQRKKLLECILKVGDPVNVSG